MSVDQKRELNKLKHDLENWRELILLANSLLKWEKHFFPLVIFGSISTIFLILWYLDYSTLTLICLLGLFVILFDYLYPMLSKFVFKSENWTAVQENKFQEACNEICAVKMRLQGCCENIFAAKDEKSAVFTIAMCGALIFGAYVGSVIDNLLLSYLFVVALAFLPGLHQHGFISKVKNQFGGLIASKINQIKNNGTKAD